VFWEGVIEEEVVAMEKKERDTGEDTRLRLIPCRK
jgi:hypothetical protein